MGTSPSPDTRERFPCARPLRGREGASTTRRGTPPGIERRPPGRQRTRTRWALSPGGLRCLGRRVRVWAQARSGSGAGLQRVRGWFGAGGYGGGRAKAGARPTAARKEALRGWVAAGGWAALCALGARASRARSVWVGLYWFVLSSMARVRVCGCARQGAGRGLESVWCGCGRGCGGWPLASAPVQGGPARRGTRVGRHGAGLGAVRRWCRAPPGTVAGSRVPTR